MTDQVLLTLLLSPELEDAVVDWLLGSKSVGGFSSHGVSGHSSRLEGMSLKEQVAGRTRRVCFEVQLARGALGETLAGLREVFADSGMHYWVVPVLEAGSL